MAAQEELTMAWQEFFTPIQRIWWSGCRQNIYIKRDDLIGFSFGGNKVRIAAEYLADMQQKNCDCMIAYGSSRSNLCRVAANLCSSRKIPCYVVTSISDKEDISDTFNSIMVRDFGAHIRYCRKDQVACTIESLMKELKDQGYHPYYIYGDIYGKGNEDTAAGAYEKAYQEIIRYEEEQKLHFDRIFLASGTGMTQGGLVRGQKKYGGSAEIIGISISRLRATGTEAVSRYAKEDTGKINFLDDYICGGYGQYNEEIRTVIRDMMRYQGIPFDTTYTGKAFWGMLKWLENCGRDGENALFIHTGGTPLFFDNVKTLSEDKNMV